MSAFLSFWSGGDDHEFEPTSSGPREIVRAVMQEMLEAEMTDALGAEKAARLRTRARATTLAPL